MKLLGTRLGPRRRVLAGVLAATLALGIVGCKNFRHLRKDLDQIEQAATLSGKVRAGDWQGGAIDVYLFDVDPQYGKPIRISQMQSLEKPRSYVFRVRPGLYMVGATEDLDGNGELDPGEPHAVYDDLAIIEAKPGKTLTRLNMTLSEVRAPALDRMGVEKVVVDYDLHMGVIASLDDARFDPSTGAMGMWTPFQFFENYGAGIFMLGAYDANKIPVLFIHGMSGHPREFTTLIESLDAERYQPWVFQYPSGTRLQNVVNALRKILRTMDAKSSYNRMCLVAHSMGGLVAHQLVRDLARAEEGHYVKFLATIASPLGGIPSADTGVKMAPEVVPSWRDVGPKSQFVQSLFDRPFPDGVEYALYFGFGSSTKKSKQGSDGTVLVRNALPRAAQDSATVVSGFPANHVEILSNEALVAQLNGDLAELCSPR